MDLQRSIIDFIIVTLPGVFLYFLGWIYLYYFLNFFGINISELQLDTSTVFIYSYSPIYDLIVGHLFVAMLLAFAIFSILFTSVFDLFSERMLAFLRKHTFPVRVRWINHRWPSSFNPSWRVVYLTVVLFLTIVCVFNLVLIPIAISGARLAAGQKWKGDTRSILVNLNLEEKPNSSELTEDFNACQLRGAMVQIFSDENTLFLLCRSPDDPRTGSVFEIKKERGVVSSRYVIEEGG
jgi:hypothetical protein